MAKKILFSLAALVAAALLPACEDGCTPTVMVADESRVADLSDVAASAVLSARLTSNGVGLPGKTVEFYVEQLDEKKLAGEATTDSEGRARLDLKTRPVALARGTLSQSYSAEFDYDGVYCSAADEAEFKAL
jgi:hypothetical protein